MENIIASKPGEQDLVLNSSDKYLIYEWKNKFGAIVYTDPSKIAAIEHMLINGYTIHYEPVEE